MEQSESTTGQKFKVIRHPVDSLNLYEVREDELESLEKGSHGSLALNFGIFLLSTGISFLIALIVNEIEPGRKHDIFVAVTALGLVIGTALLIVWWLTRVRVKDVIKKIKARQSAD
jgi:hypothetical protein